VSDRTGGATTPPVDPVVDPQVAAFIYLEARLADEACYSDWEALWADDASYWVPRHPDADPQTEVSYIYDNRRRIASRIAQLNTGARHSQTPPSKIRRVLGNMEVIERDGSTVTVGSNFMLFEYRFSMVIWAGRYVHRVRTEGGEYRLVDKIVHLVNGDDPITNMSFLI
jgi:3-phenylpropionate/cinnamic acid dioxygenase small subunit